MLAGGSIRAAYTEGYRAHLPPPITIGIILFDDADRLSDFKGDFVCILCHEFVQAIDAVLLLHGDEAVAAAAIASRGARVRVLMRMMRIRKEGWVGFVRP